MSNQFHRRLTDSELHRPERSGEGNPNDQSLFQPEDGQYYQDTLTGSVWRYRSSQNQWELLIEYDRTTGEIVNISSEAAQNYNVQTSKVGELKTAILKDELVTSVSAYLYTQVRKGEEIELINKLNPEQSITFTVSSTTPGGDVNIAVQANRSPYAFAAGTPIYFDAALFNTYQSSDPTRILRAIEEERFAVSIGVISITPLSTTTELYIDVTAPEGYRDLEDGQLLRIYILTPRAGGVYQYVTVDGDQTLSGFSDVITVQEFTPQYTFVAGYSFVETASVYSMTRIIQTSNTVSILSQTVSGQGNSIATLNTTTGNLQSSINAIVEVNNGQNTAISAAELTANNAAAIANLSVTYDEEGAYVKLYASNKSSEITLAADQINISGVITAINDEGSTQINGSKIETGTILASALVPNYSYIIKSNTAPTTYRESLSPEEGFLQDGDVWINTAAAAGRDSYVFDASDSSGNGNWVAMFTEIDGGRIITGSLTASQINVADLFAQSIDVGNVIKSENFDSNNGFAIYSNGDAIFRDVTTFTTNNFVNNTSGVLITESESQFNGRVFINGRPDFPRLEFQTASGNSLGVIQGANVSGSEFFVIGSDERLTLEAGTAAIEMQGGASNYIEINTDELKIVNVTTGTSASAGTGGAPPAQVAGYLTVKIDGSTRKIPYYN